MECKTGQFWFVCFDNNILGLRVSNLYQPIKNSPNYKR
jgi:hypothetical protein